MPYSGAMLIRRLFTAALFSVITVGLVWLVSATLGVGALAEGGWSAGKVAFLLCFAGTAPWTALCATNALIGFAVLMLTRDPPRFIFAVEDRSPFPGATPRTAIAVTVRNEDMATVLPPLRRLLNGLDASGNGDAFALFILSDTQDAAAAQTEERAVAAFQATDPHPARVHYRRRTENIGFKAGNVMEFLDNHAAPFELMLALDADSAMSAHAVLRMVRAMAADPQLAIAQHLIVGRPAVSAFPRLFQFGMRAGMRTWAIGQGWWQGDAGPYWGHNAIVRIAPFREVCRLPRLPDGSHILSHDQVEAALLAGAGWKVRVLPDEAGSSEANPPALPEFLRRDARWLAGNLQYRHLLTLPGLSAMGRWQLSQAILLFAGAPLYTAMIAIAALLAATGATVPAGAAAWAMLAWGLALYAPKLLGYMEILLKPAERARYGGARRFVQGAASEFVFTLLLDAIGTVGKTLAMVRLALGMREGWVPQNRADRGVSWREAAQMLWPQSLFGLACFVGLAMGGVIPILWALPLAGGLLLAIPLCVFTADPELGDWLHARDIAAIPEELT